MGKYFFYKNMMPYNFIRSRLQITWFCFMRFTFSPPRSITMCYKLSFSLSGCLAVKIWGLGGNDHCYCCITWEWCISLMLNLGIVILLPYFVFQTSFVPSMPVIFRYTSFLLPLYHSLRRAQHHAEIARGPWDFVMESKPLLHLESFNCNLFLSLPDGHLFLSRNPHLGA